MVHGICTEFHDVLIPFVAAFPDDEFLVVVGILKDFGVFLHGDLTADVSFAVNNIDAVVLHQFREVLDHIEDGYRLFLRAQVYFPLN